MKVTRRGFLKGAGAAGAAASLPTALIACGDDTSTPPPEPMSRVFFIHGVASGDPLEDRVIIWTRVTPPSEQAQPRGRADGAVDDGEIEVIWEVATDTRFRNIVAGGSYMASAERDYTVKVDVDGLEPATTYFYRFHLPEEPSPIGRTRTAPAGEVDGIRFAVCSCQSMTSGYYTLYDDIAARRDLDAVLHLGDYIYEGGSSEGSLRQHDPTYEIVSLDDYRRRHAWYKLDGDLQEAHRQHPFICVWDDHESANNSWEDGASAHQPETEGDWPTRKAIAQQVYEEWMPIRTDDPARIWRTLRFGTLLDLMMLDTRLYGRDQQDMDDRDNPDRTLLGEEQEAWLGEQLEASSATWKVLGQQVMCGQLQAGGQPLNEDQWDGYQAARDLLFSQIENTPGGNVVVLTGDIHTSWAMDLSYDPLDPEVYTPETGEGAVAVEFVASAISSSGLPTLSSPTIVNIIRDLNPHIKFVNVAKRGFVLLDVRPERVQGDFYLIDQVETPGGTVEWETGWYTDSGTNRLRKAESATSPGRAADRPLAPIT